MTDSLSLDRAIARQTALLQDLKFSVVGLQRERRKRSQLYSRDVVIRAACVELLRQQVGTRGLEPREDVLGRIYGNCAATSHYLKAATNPAATNVIQRWRRGKLDPSDHAQRRRQPTAFSGAARRGQHRPPGCANGVCRFRR